MQLKNQNAVENINHANTYDPSNRPNIDKKIYVWPTGLSYQLDDSLAW